MNDQFFQSNMLVHTHLEKTAGSSFVNGLIAIFGKDRVYDVRGHTKPKELTDEEKTKIDVLTGHFRFGAHRLLFPRNFVYVGFVREPFERFQSFFRYVKDSPEHPGNAVFGHLSQSDAIDLYLKEKRGAADNYLCRYFSGARERSFDNARQNIERRYLVAAPHYAVGKVLDVLARVRNVELATQRVDNVGRSEKSDEGRDAFVAANAEDYKLYNYVVENHESWIKNFDARLAKLRR